MTYYEKRQPEYIPYIWMAKFIFWADKAEIYSTTEFSHTLATSVKRQTQQTDTIVINNNERKDLAF